MSAAGIRPFCKQVFFGMLLLLLPAILSYPVQAAVENEEVQQQFNRANFMLEQREYDAALDLFLEIEASGFYSGPLFLNTGLAYVHLVEPGLATYYFTRASGFRQTQAQAERGLAYLDQYFAQQQPEAPVLASYEWYNRLHFELGYQKPLLWALIFLNFAALSWAGFWFTQKGRLVFRYVAYVMIALSLLSGALSAYIYSEKGDWRPGMIVFSNFDLREAPDPEGEAVLRLYPGYPLMQSMQAEHQHPDWTYVYMSNGLKGWVSQEAVRVFPE